MRPNGRNNYTYSWCHLLMGRGHVVVRLDGPALHSAVSYAVCVAVEASCEREWRCCLRDVVVRCSTLRVCRN